MRVRYFVFILAALLAISALAVACGPSAAPTPTVAPTKPAAPTAAATKPAAAASPTIKAAPTTTASVASPTTAAKPALPTTAAPAAGGNAAAGQAVFTANCNACHPNGQKGVGPDIRGASVNEVKRQVRNGGGSMPAFTASQISDTQLSDLAAYVSSLK